MNASAVPDKTESYLGHVRQGVIVPDVPMEFMEGTPVRFELLPMQPDIALAEKLKEFDELMKMWDEEDAQLTEEQQDVLRKALEENRGISFRDNQLDNILK